MYVMRSLMGTRSKLRTVFRPLLTTHSSHEAVNKLECNRLAEQSFGMFNIHKDYILFKLCLAKKKERSRKSMNKINIFKFHFLDLVKG